MILQIPARDTCIESIGTAEGEEGIRQVRATRFRKEVA
jgi:hypothetical protein